MQNIFRILMLAFLLTCNLNLQAQNPINIDILGSCNMASGIYDFYDLINSKNSYFKTFNDGSSGSINIYVKFDGIKWILNSGEIITDDILFINTIVPPTLLPPNSGWILGNCPNGTMTIDQILSNKQFENYKLEIFPNPTYDFIEIKNVNESIEKLNYKIIDLTGRIIKNDFIVINEKIDLRLLKFGTYILEIISNQYVSKIKVIKK